MHIHVLTFLLSTLLPFIASTQNNDQNEEQNILLGLKQQWSNPPSLTNWIPDTDHCTWPEVTCSGGSVTGISIVNGGIADVIPPSICDLKNLTYIDLSSNTIPGNFPTVLYNCTMLEHLNLSYNYLVGAIPDDISRLSPRLQVMILDLNNFTGDIPPAIGSLPGLTTLSLMSNLFNGSFPAEIANLLNLEELVLSYNPFTPQPIPQRFTEMKKVRNLWMTTINLIGEIPDGIGNMSALEQLDLSVNTMNGSIPEGLFLLNNLTFLYLYKNNFSGSIPQIIESVNLQIMDLSNNSLTGSIPEDFGKLTGLTGLALFFNQLSGGVPENISRLPGLIDFAVFNNNLSGTLPPDFGLYSNLRTFQVSSNQFSGELPQHLCYNKALLGVIAFENNLTGGLPDSLSACSALTTVQVHENALTGNVSNGLWTSTNLATLKLSNNMFSGQLPEEIGPSLSRIEMSHNQFSGPIPAGISSSWEALTVFGASNNSLSGGIPQAFTALPHLTTLLLDVNQLSGPLPSTMENWTSLTTLNLSGNQLSGEIPASLGQLPDLASLDLSRNEFSGQIPSDIGSRISLLNLSSNRLSGKIPTEFENAAFDSSFLDNPGLCSDVPTVGLPSCAVMVGRKSTSRSSQFIAIVSSIAAVALLLSLLCGIYVFRSYNRMKEHISDSNWKFTPFQRLNFTESTILPNLTDDNVIGKGGSGSVYRVPLHGSGEYVAVKKIWNNVKLDQKLEKEFLAEAGILSTIRHSNIVKLLCCISGDNSKLLVYEYMENRSLDIWLHGKKRPYTLTGALHPYAVLDWPKRLQIAIGAAQGLSYMHHDCSPAIIHRDVKSSNVLLDSEFNAKIADFGLARMMIRHGEPNTMSVVAGSFGYMAPEYAQTRRVTEKIDVYSFGVILLELVTGREAHNGDECSSLAEWAWRHVQQGKPTLDALDEDIQETQYMEEINTVLKLGLICTSKAPSSRPQMKDVLQILIRCSKRPPPPGAKIDGSEHDFAPLLRNSKIYRPEERDDSVYVSI